MGEMPFPWLPLLLAQKNLGSLLMVANFYVFFPQRDSVRWRWGGRGERAYNVRTCFCRLQIFPLYLLPPTHFPLHRNMTGKIAFGVKMVLLVLLFLCSGGVCKLELVPRAK